MTFKEKLEQFMQIVDEAERLGLDFVAGDAAPVSAPRFSPGQANGQEHGVILIGVAEKPGDKPFQAAA